MEQTIYKRRWAPFIVCIILYLFFAFNDSAYYGEAYCAYLLPSTISDFSSIITCIQGTIIITSLFFSIYDKKNYAMVAAGINIILSLIPIIRSLIKGWGVSLTLSYSIVFILISALLILYNKTSTNKFWQKAPRILLIAGALSIVITFILSFVSMRLLTGRLEFSQNTWRHFGSPLDIRFHRTYRNGLGFPISLIPLFNGPSSSLGFCASLLYPLSCGILYFLLATGLNVNRKKAVTIFTNTQVDWTGYCSLGKHIALSLLTFGIWPLIWTYRTTDFLNKTPYAKQYSPINQVLLCMFIPFYQLYWYYKHGERIETYSYYKKLGFSNMATLSLILGIFIPIVANIIMQDRINAICMTHDPAPEEKPQSSSNELREFKKLLDEGIISQEEFDAKKKQLLGL